MDATPKDRVQLFGEFCIIHGSQTRFLSLLSSQKIITLLCQRPDYIWPRAELGRTLWPDSDDESNRNRIRTALVQINSGFTHQATIQAEKNTLAINAQLIECDLWQAKSRLRHAQASVDETEEEQALRNLLQIINRPYLPAFQDSWADFERRRWRDRALDSKMRLAAFAESRQDWPTSIDLYESALSERPYDEKVWAAILRVYTLSGRHIEIVERFNQTRSILRRELKGKFTSSLISLAESYSSGRNAEPEISTSQSEIVSRTFVRMMKNSPKDALQFLSQDAFRSEIYRSPQLAKDLLDQALLDQALAATTENDDSRLQCIGHAVIANSILNNRQEVQRLAPIILDHDTNLTRLRGAGTALSFAYFQTRDWEQAYHYGEQTIETAIKIGDPVGIQLAHAQIAAFDWHLGKFEKATQTYRDNLKVLAKHKTPAALIGSSIITVNLGILQAIQGESALAIKNLSKGINLAELANHHSILDLALPVLGAMKIQSGDRDQGTAALTRGITLAYRHKDQRTLEIALDFAALALASLNSPSKALAIIELARQYRHESEHPRSIAEEMLVTTIQNLCPGAQPDPHWLNLPTSKHLISAIFKLLAENSR